MKIKFFLAGLFLLIFMAGSWGCAGHRIYSINMQYEASGALIPAYLKADQKSREAFLSVADFHDMRKTDDPMVIGRVIEKDGMKVLVLPKNIKPTMAVANGVKFYLDKAGYRVSDKIVSWDLRESTIPAESSKILIGGSIDSMEINCRRAFPTNTYSSKIKMTIYVADSARKKILYKTTVEASTSREHVFFSEERLGYEAGDALGAAIEKLFEERAVAQNIKTVF
jgi:hypothetical protein